MKRNRQKQKALRRLATLVLVLAVAACFPAAAQADIYRWVAPDGVVHYTNVPGDSRYELYIKEGNSFRPRPVPVATPRARTPEPPPEAARYDRYIREAALTHRLDENLIRAMISVESNFNPRAVSSKGAAGLMQIMPQNFSCLGLGNPFDPRDNILAGSRYFRGMVDRFGGDIRLALAAYNAGPTVVERHQAIPPFTETRRYVTKVMQRYFEYRKAAREARLSRSGGAYRVER